MLNHSLLLKKDDIYMIILNMFHYRVSIHKYIVQVRLEMILTVVCSGLPPPAAVLPQARSILCG